MNEGQSLSANAFHWDIARARQYDGFVQVLAVWQDPTMVKPCFSRAMQYIRAADKIEQEDIHFKLCRNTADLENGLMEKKVCGVLALEGGECLEGNIENLELFYQAGVRVLTLTWNHSNALGDGAEEPLDRGLTPFGCEVVEWMQQKGMIIDISHAAEKTFWDCIARAKRPIIASHSNARQVHDHPRNLTDEQIKAVAKTGGVIGVNFYTKFIGPSGSADLAALIKHIEHMLEVAGVNAVGLGSDFDGMYSLPEPVTGVESLYTLFNALARMNYTEDLIEKIAGQNFLRIFRNTLEHTGNYKTKQTTGINFHTE
jgi:membrane dipeptidase